MTDLSLFFGAITGQTTRWSQRDKNHSHTGWTNISFINRGGKTWDDDVYLNEDDRVTRIQIFLRVKQVRLPQGLEFLFHTYRYIKYIK